MITGMLAHDPEFATAKNSGKEYATFSIINETGNLHCAVFGEQNLTAARSISEGSVVTLTGNLKTRTTNSQSGGTFVNIDIWVSKVEPIDLFDAKPAATQAKQSQPAQTVAEEPSPF